MLKKPATRRSRIAAATGSIIATAALTFGGLHALAPTDTMGAEVRTANFTSQFLSEEKPLEVVGQWARSSYRANASTDTVADSPYRTTPQTTVTNQFACAHGGSGDLCGQQDTRSGANITLPAQAEVNWTPSGFGKVAMYFQLDQSTKTAASCTPDNLVGSEPEWGIRYGNASHRFASPKGMKTLRWNEQNKAMDNNPLQSNKRFNRLQPGQTHTEIHKAANNGETYVEIRITSDWGKNDNTKEAWSELVITAQPFFEDNRTQVGPKWTYTFSSRCGLNMNNNTGSTGPSTSTVSSGAVPPEVDIDFGAEVPSTDPSEDAISALESFTSYGRPEEIQHMGATFLAEATRELSYEDHEHISAVLNQAANAFDENGMVDGLAWIRRQANGLPVVTLELPSGGYARVTPEVELIVPEIPVEEAPDLEATAEAIATEEVE